MGPTMRSRPSRCASSRKPTRSRGNPYLFFKPRAALTYLGQASSSPIMYASMHPYTAPAGSANAKPASHPNARPNVSPLVSPAASTVVYLWKRHMARAARQLFIGVVGSAVDTGTADHSVSAAGSQLVMAIEIEAGITADRPVNHRKIAQRMPNPSPIGRLSASLRQSAPVLPDSVRFRATSLASAQPAGGDQFE